MLPALPHGTMAGMDISRFIQDCVTHHQNSDDATLGRGLTRLAGAIAADMRNQGLDTEYKTSVSDVVTAADRAAEEFVAGVLEALRPTDGVLGEEGASRASQSGKTWVIDPVDGTYNFTSGLDYYCSALALIDEHGAPIFGSVSQPKTDSQWFGGPEFPTTVSDIEVVALKEARAKELSIATYLHPRWMHDDAVREAWLKVAREFATVRMFGAGSVDLALVAEGKIGAWMQHTVADWDWLPGKALVEAAGGATAKVDAGGVTWCVAGNTAVVEEITSWLE